MKQSNSAIKYLLAHYRSIFKHAYFKGLVSAVALTAGLAAGQAQAYGVGDLAGNTDPITVDGTPGKTLSDSLTQDKSWTVGVTITGGALGVSPANKIDNTGATGDVTLSGNGTLTLKAPSGNGILFTTAVANKLTVDIAQIDVQSGELQLSAGTGSGGLILAADKIDIGGQGPKDSKASAILKINASSNIASGTVTLGRTAANNVSGSVITVKNGGLLDITGSESGAKVIGDSLSIASGGVLLTSGGQVSLNSDLTEVANGGYWVVSGATTATSHETNINGGLLVSGGSLTITAASTTFEDPCDIDEVGSLTLKSGSTLELHNGITVTQGVLNVESGAGMHAAKDAGTNISGTVVVKGTASGVNFSSNLAKDLPTIRISSTDLKKFLDGGNTYQTIKYTDGTIDRNTSGESLNGSLVLTSGGRLLLTDDKVDLTTTFNFAATNSDNAHGQAGLIVLTKSGSPGIISGSNITISDKLRSAQGATPSVVTDQLNLNVEADNLTLGNDSYSGNASLLFNDAQVSNSLTLKASGSTFSLANDIYLSRPFFVQEQVADSNQQLNTFEQNTAGQILGDDLDINGTAQKDSTILSVARGNWEASNDITVTKGSLQVGAPVASPNYNDATAASSSYENDGKFSQLKLNGTLSLAGKAFKPNEGIAAIVSVIGGKGANATLDISSGSVDWGDTNAGGAVYVQGSLIDTSDFVGSNDDQTAAIQDFYEQYAYDGQIGWGKLILDSDDFENYLDSGSNSESTLTIKSGGVVVVEGDLTDRFDAAQFISGDATSTSHTNALDANKVYFAGGVLDINGDLNITSGQSGDSDASGAALAFGKGTIKVDNLNLHQYQQSNKVPVAFAVSGGNLVVRESLSTNSSALEIKATATDSASLTLEAGVSGSGTITTGTSGTIKLIGNSAPNHASTLKVNTGAWTTTADIEVQANGSLVVGNGSLVTDFDDAEGTRQIASFSADNFSDSGAANSSALVVNKFSSADFNTMQLAGSEVNVAGHLLIKGAEVKEHAADKPADPSEVNMVSGTSSTAGIDFNGTTFNVSGAGSQLEFGSIATAALVKDNKDHTDSEQSGGSWSISDELLADSTINLENFAELKLNLTENDVVSKYDAKQFAAIVDNFSTDNTGVINLGDASLGVTWDNTVQDGQNRVQWDEVADFVRFTGGAVTTNQMKSALVMGVDRSNTNVQGSFGAIQVKSDNTNPKLTLDGTTSLHNASGFGGHFVFSGTEKEPVAVDVKLTKKAALGLDNGGVIGAVQGSDDYDDASYNKLSIFNTNGTQTLTDIQGSVTKINEFTVESNTQVLGTVNVNYLDLASSLNVASDGKQSVVKANAVDLTNNAVLNVSELQIGKANGSSQPTAPNSSYVMGVINADKAIEIEEGELNVLDGLVKTTDLTLANGTQLTVGYEPASSTISNAAAANSNREQGFNEQNSYSGFFEATGTTTLNGGLIAVDPEYHKATAMMSLNNLSGSGVSEDSLYAGALDGAAYVGQNSVLGVGSENLSKLQSKIASYQQGISLDQNSIGAIMYLGKAMTIQGSQSGLSGVTLTADSYENFIKHFNSSNGNNDFKGDFTNDQAPVMDNTFYFGANTAVVVDSEVMTRATVSEAVDSSRSTTTNAMITFDPANGNTTKGTVIADGGQIIVDGDLRANTYQVFSNADIKYIDGTQYTIDATDKSGEVRQDKLINVSTDNEFLIGLVDKDGKVKLGVNPNSRSIMFGASDPVHTTLVAYAQGYNGDEETADSQLHKGFTTVTGADGKPVKVKNTADYSNPVLQNAISTGNGAEAEQVTRFGIYGGSVQAAISAGATTSDAIAGRMGMGAQNGSVTFADNSQGAGLWVAPIYKSHDSDGFGAQGVSYGADISMYGLALGGDYTLDNGLRVGAMFNVGSGDADGQGAGAGVSNDFNYYGFSVYGGFSMDKFSVVGDVSYTVVDNDISANSSLGKVSSSFDSSNLSVGVTGQYALNLDAVDITPHAGLRYTYVDMDNYSVNGEGELAHYTGDSMSYVSIPVGVTFSKEIVTGSWTIKPAFDLTLTANMGDDSMDGSVTWTDVDNLETKVESEVLDSFTYGATLGVSAKSGNFSFGLGVNYTGASNADEYGVNANARFVF